MFFFSSGLNLGLYAYQARILPTIPCLSLIISYNNIFQDLLGQVACHAMGHIGICHICVCMYMLDMCVYIHTHIYIGLFSLTNVIILQLRKTLKQISKKRASFLFQKRLEYFILPNQSSSAKKFIYIYRNISQKH